MSTNAWIFAFAGALLFMEVVFFFVCGRFLSRQGENRERVCAQLDAQREELLQLQSSVKGDLVQAQNMTSEALTQLERFGAKLHGEFDGILDSLGKALDEAQEHVRALETQATQRLSTTLLGVEKALKEASTTRDALNQQATEGRKLLRLFDAHTPTDEILRELQVEKYARARDMLQNGADPSVIREKLGLTQAELSLLTFTGP